MLVGTAGLQLVSPGDRIRFLRRGFQGECLGNVLRVSKARTGRVSAWVLVTHWNDGSGQVRVTGSTAVWLSRGILEVLPTTKGA